LQSSCPNFKPAKQPEATKENISVISASLARRSLTTALRRWSGEPRKRSCARGPTGGAGNATTVFTRASATLGRVHPAVSGVEVRPDTGPSDHRAGGCQAAGIGEHAILSDNALSRPAAATDAGYTTVTAARSAAAARATRDLPPAAARSAAPGGTTGDTSAATARSAAASGTARNGSAATARSPAASRSRGCRRGRRRGRRHHARRRGSSSCRSRGARRPTFAAAAADRQNKHGRTAEQRDYCPSFRLHSNSPNLISYTSRYPGCV
jgi:hypothetical protein